MAVGQGGADGADNVILARLVLHHHVHVPFYDDHLPSVLNVRAGQVQAVQDGALVEYRRLGRVHVLGHLALV